MERPTKGRVKGSRWSGSNNEEDCGVDGKCNGSSSSGGASEGEEGYIFRALLNSNGHSSRKRIKLQAKVTEDCKPVDPAMVPRRLRSVINKRPRQSVSPSLSDSKRKQLHALNGTQLSNGFIAERFRQNKLDQVTKDEEEVAVALTMLASPISESKLIKNKEDMITPEENSETKEALTCFSEAPKEEPTKILLPCNGSIGTNSSPCVEESHEDVLKAQPSALGQQIAASVSQNFDAGMNRTSQPGFRTTPLSMNGKGGDVTSLRDDAKNSSSSLGTSLQYLAGNGRLQEIQVGASSMRRPDVGLWPLGSAPVELDLQSVKQKLESGTTHYISQKETTPVMWPGLPSSSHGHLTIPSSKTTGSPKSVSASARRGSTTNVPPTEMFSSIDRKAPRKKCATHVYISHIIRNYQSTEKRLQASQPVNQSKAKEGTSSTSQTARGPAGLRNNKVHQSIGFHIEKSSIQDSTQMLHDGRILQAQLISTVSGAYGQQKQVGELSLSAAGDAKDSGNESKSLSGQLNVPYLPPHSLRTFPFARGPYPSPYQDQLAAAASHQMASQNDGRIPGGPTTDMIIQQRAKHRSSLVFYGKNYDYNKNERCRQHVSWRHDSDLGYWRLSDYQVGLLNIFGFYYVDKIHFLQHDRDLIFSLVERWWPGRNTFQLPFGEMTIILADVANILGLPITGEPIIFDKSISADTMVKKYLGVKLPEKTKTKNFVTFTWLRQNFLHLDRIGDQVISVDDDREKACTRAYLLGLISGILFPDSSDCVDLRFLPFLVDLSEPTPHAWGASVLAHLYHCMTEFVQFEDANETKKNLSGCATLIQVWSYEHFHIGRPVSRIHPDEAVFPSALRWTTDAADPVHCEQAVVSLYRVQFDTLKYNEVTYLPYRLLQNRPEIQATAYDFSVHRFFIIFHGIIMYHPADRVLRQFWVKQGIPDEPPCLNRGRGSAEERARRMIPQWHSRLETHPVAHTTQLMESIDDALGDIAYRTWWGAPLISNREMKFEELRFQPRAVDDASFREWYKQVYDMLPELNLAYENHPVRDPLSRTVKSFLDRVQAIPTPPNPPLHIPPDYPQGVVEPRQARPRRRYTNVWRMDSPSQQDDEVPQQAEQDSFTQADQGTYQWADQGTYQWAGQGTSQQADQGTYQWTGQGTTPQMNLGADEGTSQPVSDWNWDSFTQTASSIFAAPELDPSSQLFLTPTAPVQGQDDFDPWEPLPWERPEDTAERRNRLGLRPRPRRYYDRMARGRE